MRTPLQRRSTITKYAVVYLFLSGCLASIFIVWNSTTPDPGILYDLDKRTSRDSLNYFIERIIFVEGAKEAINGIKNNKPVRVVSTESPQSLYTSSVAAYGIETEICDRPIEAFQQKIMARGTDASLRWYAGRGIYAVNSSKYQKTQKDVAAAQKN